MIRDERALGWEQKDGERRPDAHTKRADKCASVCSLYHLRHKTYRGVDGGLECSK
jgi:hypothetical protein